MTTLHKAAQAALDSMERIKQGLMRQRRFGTDSINGWRSAATQAEGDVEELLIELRAALAQESQHPDDAAVDAFAEAMKAKMAKQRERGYAGWHDPQLCPAERLQKMLVEHVAKSDPVDVGNFAMMLFNRGEKTS